MVGPSVLSRQDKFERQIIVDLLKNAGVDKIRAFTEQDIALEVLEVYNANIIIAAFEMGPLDGAAWTKDFPPQQEPARPAASRLHHVGRVLSRSMAERVTGMPGANALIGKPISSKVLLATIESALRTASVHRSGRLCRPVPPRWHRHGGRAENAARPTKTAPTPAMTLERAVEELAEPRRQAPRR
ncbi:MAG: hypothetical protein R3C16_00590 [Hyphomonadaceae bacterium]